MIARSLRLKIYYVQKDFWRNNRIIFPSPAEVEFVRLMGGKAIVIDSIKHPNTKFPLTIFTSMGRMLRREFVQREVRVGGMYVDFAFVTKYAKKAIEIDGQFYHRDIVKEQSRDDYLKARGWRVMHIEAVSLYREPARVQQRVLAFLAE